MEIETFKGVGCIVNGSLTMRLGWVAPQDTLGVLVT